MQELEKILEEIEQAKREPWYRLSNYDVKHKLDGAINRIVDIIRKYMNDGWIPVEERLPDKEGAYLVTYQRDKKQCEEFDLPKIDVHSDYFRGGIWFNNCFSGGRNIAWRPLPEPYRLERNEGE